MVQGISQRLYNYGALCSHSISAGVSLTVKTTYKIAEAVFKWLSYCITFPLRYGGAKDWSIPGIIIRTPYMIFKRVFGASSPGKSLKEELFNPGVRTAPQLASQEEVRQHLKRIAMAAFAHSSNPEWIEPFGYKTIDPRTLGVKEEGVQAKSHCFFDPQTGLKIVLAEKGNEIAIGFGAIGSDQSEVPDVNGAHKKMFRKQNVRAACNIIGGDLTLFNQASNLITQLLNNSYFQNKNIVFSGQCLGGALAQFCALKYKRKGYCYNSLQLGAGLQWQLGQEAIIQANDYVTHLYVKGDFLNNWKGQGIVDQVLSRVGLKTPGNFGRQYYIPAAYTARADIHNHCLGSVMQHLGFDKRVKPKELPPAMLH